MPYEFIYLDNNATTKIDERILDEMLPFLKEQFGNPSSLHRFGLLAKKSIEVARSQISTLYDINPKGVVFTSGATEAINLGIKGLAQKRKHKGNHIITIATEHTAVLNTYKYLETIGFDVTYLKVNRHGTINIDEFAKHVSNRTILVSAMFANNETGVLLPIEEIATIAKEKGALVFSDLTQAVGKIDINPFNIGVDAICISGHKIHGPKGVGALIFDSGTIGNIPSILHGGDQEFGMRGGTLNVPGIIGLGKACEIVQTETKLYYSKTKSQRDFLEQVLMTIPGSFVNGIQSQRIPNTSNICFPGIDANVLVSKLTSLAISNGSACNSAVVTPSHVLTEMGLTPTDASASIRISLSKFTTDEEIKSATEMLHKSIQMELQQNQNYA